MEEGSTYSTESVKDFDTDVQRWLAELHVAEREFHNWWDRSKKIVKRYRDQRSDLYDTISRDSLKKLNIFWANVQTLGPALYARTPKIEVERRFKDSDPLARVGATVLERTTSTMLSNYDFDSFMKNVRDDYLIVGRGVGWVRYVSHMKSTTPKNPLIKSSSSTAGNIQISEDDVGTTLSTYTDVEGRPANVAPSMVRQDENGNFYTEGEPFDEVAYEEAVCDYIHWGEFLHSPARRWDEVRWVARIVYMTKDELTARFGEEKAAIVPLDYEPDNLSDADKQSIAQKDLFKKARIFEVWDKPSKKVYWISKGVSSAFLDEREDPLKLKDFFPCPRPLYATTSTDSLIPIADFVFYQDQARLLDELTNREYLLIKALRVAGVYDASCDGIKRLLDEGADNQLIPIADWPTFSSRGGFEGAVQFMPLADIAAVLDKLAQKKSEIKNEIYEITGISDIIRGYSASSETATAQEIKGRFAALRLDDRQSEVNRFARDIIRMLAEIAAEHFSDQTLALMSGISVMRPDEQRLFNQALALLRNDSLRTYRVDVETDSMIKVDEDADKRARIEFINSLSGFIQSAGGIIQVFPSMTPLVGELITFASRGFKVGRQLEGAIESAIQSTVQSQQDAQNNPQQTPEDPRIIEARMRQEIDAQKLQLEGQKLQFEQQKIGLEQQKIQLESQRIQLEAQRYSKELELKQSEIATDAAFEQQKLQTDSFLRQKEIESTLALKVVQEQVSAEQVRQQHQQQQQPVIIPAPVEHKKPSRSKIFLSTDEMGNRVAITETLETTKIILQPGINGDRTAEVIRES